MIKKESQKEKKSTRRVSDNGHGIEEIKEAVQAILHNQVEDRERIEELERGRDGSKQAQVIAANMIYNTPREQKRGFTVISLRMVDPFSLADTCAAILSDDVQHGKVSLGQIRRESIYDYLRSVKGKLLDRGADLAMRQEESRVEEGQGWEVKE